MRDFQTVYHNYFFLKRLAGELNELLRGSKIAECFSQSKDELIIGFDRNDQDQFIRANLQPKVCALHFSDSFQRARKNSVDLFAQLIDRPILKVRVFDHDRSFSIICEGNLELIFKMYGSRSNIILAESGVVIAIFKSNLRQDYAIIPENLNRKMPQSEDEYSGKGLASFPHLGKEIISHFFSTPENVTWDELSRAVAVIEKNPINIYHEPGTPPQLLLFDLPNSPALKTKSAIEASNFYFEKLVRFIDLDERKYNLVKDIEARIRKSESYIARNEEKLADLKQKRSYSELGDLMMANIHQFSGGVTSVEVLDFYTGNQITLKLKAELSPQACAEALYRKGKNQHRELETLTRNIREKQATLSQLRAKLEQVKGSENPGELRDWASTAKKDDDEEVLPYHRFEHKGFVILVGKNAQSNDQLTQKVATKNDLWLHARDVPGSHVIVRNKPGHNFPNEVIERAAEIAAWNSKRKTDSLCPVIYTEKKYVRKVKGAPAGQVKVEREKIIMVTPTAP